MSGEPAKNATKLLLSSSNCALICHCEVMLSLICTRELQEITLGVLVVPVLCARWLTLSAPRPPGHILCRAEQPACSQRMTGL